MVDYSTTGDIHVLIDVPEDRSAGNCEIDAYSNQRTDMFGSAAWLVAAVEIESRRSHFEHVLLLFVAQCK